jgi:hypothetical protein
MAQAEKAGAVMAMVCHTGRKECGGCMACQDCDPPKYTCDGCKEGIYEGDSYYLIEDETLCSDCIEKHRQIA